MYAIRSYYVEVNELVTPRLAMDRIIEIKQDLDAGQDFAELAREYSDDPTSANLGGDIVITSYSIHYTKLYDGLLAKKAQIANPRRVTCGLRR